MCSLSVCVPAEGRVETWLQGTAQLVTALPASRSLPVHETGRWHGEGDHRGRSPQLSATIEVVDEHETVLATGRFSTDKAGYAGMRKTVRREAKGLLLGMGETVMLLARPSSMAAAHSPVTPAPLHADRLGVQTRTPAPRLTTRALHTASSEGGG
jgi:hypothetical protein